VEGEQPRGPIDDSIDLTSRALAGSSSDRHKLNTVGFKDRERLPVIPRSYDNAVILASECIGQCSEIPRLGRVVYIDPDVQNSPAPRLRAYKSLLSAKYI
jgi:hypothetical protein